MYGSVSGTFQELYFFDSAIFSLASGSRGLRETFFRLPGLSSPLLFRMTLKVPPARGLHALPPEVWKCNSI